MKRLEYIDQEVFAQIVSDVIDKVVFRHDSAVKRSIDEFKEYLGELHFQDEKKAAMFASFVGEVTQAVVTPTVSVAAQMAEADARLAYEKERLDAEVKRIEAERLLAETKHEAAVYENTYLLPLKRSILENDRDKAAQEVLRLSAEKARIDADRARIDAQTASIAAQNSADIDLKAAEKALKESQKLSEDKKNSVGGVLDKQIALLQSQTGAFDVNKYLKGADAVGQVMGMLVTNDVSPSAGMVSAHRKMIENATGIDLSEYTSVK